MTRRSLYRKIYEPQFSNAGKFMLEPKADEAVELSSLLYFHAEIGIRSSLFSMRIRDSAH